MRFKTLDDFSWNGKRVLVRSDLNSPVIGGRVRFGERVDAMMKTINELKRKGANVVVIAHQGRPGSKDFVSLKSHARFMKLKFVNSVIDKNAVREILKLKNREGLLLENVRTLKSEYSYSLNNDFIRILAPLFDVYVNDSFSVSHRSHTSIIGFPRVIDSCIGRVMEKELKALEKLHMDKCLFILGGGKTDDKSLLIKPGRKILLGGLLGLNRKAKKNIFVPVDYLYDGKKVKDIGPKTIEIYRGEIVKAKCIFIVGPPGDYMNKCFENGTREILRAVAFSRAFSVVGGGDTVEAIDKFKINKKKFALVSLAGGALIWYVAGKKLPGLEALKKGK